MYSRLRTAVANARNQSALMNGPNHQHRNSGGSGCMTRSRANLMGTLAQPNVEHDAANSEFLINIGNEKAFISYKLDGSVMHMEHTEVPIVFEGKGVGKLLAKVIRKELHDVIFSKK